MKLISSVANQLIKDIKKILKGDKNLFIIEGKNFIQEALKNEGTVIQILELENQNNFDNSTKITINVLNSITQTKHPEGCVAICKKPDLKKIGSNIVFCDNVQDPGNVGTIIRTAIAFGYDTIFTNINPYNPKILRSTQGAIFKINIIQYSEAENELINLSKTHKIFMSSLNDDSVDFNTVKYPSQNKVVVLGNEGHGITNNLYKYANKKIYIPIKFESLNVAVAAGIILNRTNGGLNE
ncbi:RNA methyltransferase [Mycoplasma sp. ES3157-GEN-MYC]|uniref:RNA methyltransferase n=1 Tax=Mycoplasma miroungigenitalium TaxID=754515 RepID=A0A6M4JBW3_9MOLU|nr:RNA methyltransferase [Mycoplasma miroungigenitalium]MBU4690474.1 RNA methyltransferase [Mycoplasma miroungigenitalium]MBU4691741.1 RNA methyltransferase [Mycoplasma miroungigenitalium]QJR43569.1 RNA methyltransferase [Mycoplasma miroungigenitalium]